MPFPSHVSSARKLFKGNNKTPNKKRTGQDSSLCVPKSLLTIVPVKINGPTGLKEIYFIFRRDEKKFSVPKRDFPSWTHYCTSRHTSLLICPQSTPQKSPNILIKLNGCRGNIIKIDLKTFLSSAACSSWLFCVCCSEGRVGCKAKKGNRVIKWMKNKMGGIGI